MRQLASVTLKNSVQKIWSFYSTIGIQNKDVCSPVILEIRAKLIAGLCLERSVRVNIALTLAKIAHHDWPDLWPGLFDEVLSLIQGNEVNGVHGAITYVLFFSMQDFDIYLFLVSENVLF
jgi:hypothetical protein